MTAVSQKTASVKQYAKEMYFRVENSAPLQQLSNKTAGSKTALEEGWSPLRKFKQCGGRETLKITAREGKQLLFAISQQKRANLTL